MTDMLDQAQELEEMERAEGVRAVSAAIAAEGAASCDRCGDLIPPGRRAAFPAARRCLPCQERVEWERRVQGPPHYQPVEIWKNGGASAGRV